MLSRKCLVSDRVIEDDCLLVFVLWRDNPRVFMRMRVATVSLKSRLNKVCYPSLDIRIVDVQWPYNCV